MTDKFAFYEKPNDPLDIWIRDAWDIHVSRPNEIGLSAFAAVKGRNVSDFMRADANAFWKNEHLIDFTTLVPSEQFASVLTGEPGVLYQTDQISVPLTVSEVIRLTAHALRPEEFFSLRDRYGIIHEWHDDYYDPETGYAMQPVAEDAATFRM